MRVGEAGARGWNLFDDTELKMTKVLQTTFPFVILKAHSACAALKPISIICDTKSGSS